MVELSKQVTVSAPSRLHLGLIDCGHTTRRLFGGSGISIEGPRTVVTAQNSPKWSVTFTSGLSPSERCHQDLDQLLRRLDTVIKPVSLTVISCAPEHMGLGSKTSLLLSVTTASLVAREALDHPTTAIHLTERGGTSGIGVNSFWTGGLITDAGHPTKDNDRLFAPSSRRKPKKAPPVLARVKMPSTWEVHLFYDAQYSPIEGIKEQEIFSNSMPFEDLQNFSVLAAIYHGVLPAVLEKDINTLSTALRDLNGHGMKAVEVSYQTKKTQAFLEQAWKQGLACGLSSFGPIVYSIETRQVRPESSAIALSQDYKLTHFGTYCFNNSGVKIHLAGRLLRCPQLL